MITIIGDNDTGKTRKLLERAADLGATVICQHPAAMARKAEAYGIYGLTFISYFDKPSGKCVIDELEDYLHAVLPSAKIYGYTETKN